MHRRRLESAAAAVLTVAVVGLAAATLGATRTRGTGGSGGGATGGTGAGGASASSEMVAVARDPLPVFAVLGALLVVVLVVGVVRYPLDTLLEVGRSLALSAVVVAALWLLFAVLGTGAMPTGGPTGDSEGLGLGPPDGAPGGTDGAVTTPGIDALGLVLAGLLGLGLVAVAIRAFAGDEAAETRGGDADEETLAAIGRSAGRAADRLTDADADVDNEVYRAWREMTVHLDVEDPETRTPGEFRAAALSAGMARDDVDTLTDLFEAVRYGGATPTEEREAAAAASLRRIEERYADAARADADATRAGGEDGP